MSRQLQIAVASLLVSLGAYWYFTRTQLSYERIGPKPSAGSTVLIVLHGHGAPGDDLVPFARDLATELGATAYVPAGPESHGGGRTWVDDITAATKEEFQRAIEGNVAHTVAGIWELANLARARGVPCDHLYFVGFSLGGRFAIESALRAPADCEVGGVVAIAPGGGGDIPLAAGRPGGIRRALVTFGRADGVVSAPSARAWAGALAALDTDTRWLDVPGPHTIGPEARAAAIAFLRGETPGAPVARAGR